MIDLKNWLFGVICVCAVLSVCRTLLPKGKFQTILRCGGGILLLLTLLKPLSGIDGASLFRRYAEWEASIGSQTEAYQAAQTDELETLIAEKTSAYIEKKAASLGVVCHAQIRCTERDGVPFPTEVVLDIPYLAELSAQIESDLAITAEKQHWQEAIK